MEQIKKVLGKYRISGNEIIFKTCPYCKATGKDNEYKFSINKRSGLFKCFRGKCNAKGNIRQLGKFLNVRVYDDYIINPTERNYQLPVKKVNPVKKDLYDYFSKRGISEDTVDFAEIRQDGKRIVFEYFNEQGILTFRKFKTFTDKRISREKDTKPIFYMMNKVNSESKTLIITEGEEDCLSLYEIGYDFAVSLPSGSSDISCVSHNWNWLQTFKTFIIWTDDDSAGRKAEQELIKRLGREKCKIVNHKANDINETLVKFGRQAIVNIVENADYLPISKVKTANDYDIFINEEEHLKSTFNVINQSMEGGYRKGELVIWTGHRGTGKTTILTQELATLIKQSEKVCIYSAEVRNRNVLKNFYKQCSGEQNIDSFNSSYFKGKYYTPKKENVIKINKWINDNFFMIADDFDEDKLDLFEIFAQLVIQKGVTTFIIDNLMTVVRQDRDINHNQSEFMKRCKLFVKKYDTTIHIVAHQRKLNEEHSKRFRPSISGISGSANIGNIVDVVIGIARVSLQMKQNEPEKYDYDSELLILKERVTGNEGKFTKLYFNKPSLRFIENSENINYRLGWERL